MYVCLSACDRAMPDHFYLCLLCKHTEVSMLILISLYYLLLLIVLRAQVPFNKNAFCEKM